MTILDTTATAQAALASTISCKLAATPGLATLVQQYNALPDSPEKAALGGSLGTYVGLFNALTTATNALQAEAVITDPGVLFELLFVAMVNLICEYLTQGQANLIIASLNVDIATAATAFYAATPAPTGPVLPAQENALASFKAMLAALTAPTTLSTPTA